MNTKYKIEITEGCTAFNTTINGESISDLPEEYVDEVVDYILAQIRESYNRKGIGFDSIIQLLDYDTYEHDPTVCGSCGDTVSTTTWNI